LGQDVERLAGVTRDQDLEAGLLEAPPEGRLGSPGVVDQEHTKAGHVGSHHATAAVAGSGRKGAAYGEAGISSYPPI